MRSWPSKSYRVTRQIPAFFEPELAAGSYEPLWDELDLTGKLGAPVAPKSFEASRSECAPHWPSPGEAGPADQRLVDVTARVTELLKPVPVSVDELARLAKSPAQRVRSVLIELELAGRIEWHGGGLVSSAPHSEE